VNVKIKHAKILGYYKLIVHVIVIIQNMKGMIVVL